mmetsp:Transcript_2728/g.8274  ORF Transcript_2728/g.8274 Transcript_2728/m.8274 type:complete len:255 (+) Transcript_2728:162-926(+)
MDTFEAPAPWDIDVDPREAVAAREEGIKWFLTFGLKLDELGVRLDRDLAESSEPNIAVAGDPRTLEFTVRADLNRVGDLSLSFNPLNNVAKLTAEVRSGGFRAFVTSVMEGFNIRPLPLHREVVGIRLRDMSPFKTSLLQRFVAKVDLQNRSMTSKVTVRHRWTSFTGIIRSNDGAAIESALHVGRRQLLCARLKTRSWQVRWKSTETAQPFSVSLEVPYKGSWEDRLDEAVLTLRKRFVIDGMKLIDEMTRGQ